MSKYNVVRLDQTEETPLVWLWDRRLARGQLTILEGDVGVGKSSAVFDLVARFSRGRMSNGVVRTLLLCGDHSVGAVVLPRLKKAGADLGCIAVLGGRGQPAMNIREGEDLEAVGEAIVANKVDLVVIDPLTAFVGKVNLRDETALRLAMRPLIELAEKHRVAVLVVMPRRRGPMLGACGVFGVALELRAAEGGVELAAWRSSLAALAEPLVAKLWGDNPVWSVPEAEAKGVSSLDAAKLWLELYLGGKTLPMSEVVDAGGLAGHSMRTLERAKAALNYKGKMGEVDGRPVWVWIGA